MDTTATRYSPMTNDDELLLDSSQSGLVGEKPSHRILFDETFPPPLEGLGELMTLTTLVASFSVIDFGSFELEFWPRSSTIGQLYTLIYLALMAGVAGNSLAMSVKGIMVIAAYHRSRNQIGNLKYKLVQAAETVRAACEQSGDANVAKRMYQEAVTARLSDDMLHSLRVAQNEEAVLADVNVAPVPDSEGVVEVKISDPSGDIAHVAFTLWRGNRIFVMVLAYMGAQAMKALRSTQLDMFGVLCVAIVVLVLCHALAGLVGAVLLPLLSSTCFRYHYTAKEDQWKNRWQPRWLLNLSQLARLKAKLND